MGRQSREEAPDTEKADAVRQFIAELRDAPAGEHVLFGMVKPGETDDSLMFAHPGDCTRWIHIPASTIHTISASGHVRCRGHSHAAAVIRLKPPESDLEKTLTGVAALHRASLDQFLASAQGGPPGDHPCGPGQYWGQDQYGNWGCQPG
jgi:hypothetical protein